MNKKNLGTLLCFAATLLMASGTVHAGAFTFTKIVDTNTPVPNEVGTFSSFGAPALDNNQLAITGFNADFDLFRYRFSGGLLNLIQDKNTTVPDDGGTFSNGILETNIGDGKAIFKGDSTTGNEGIYTHDGLSLQKVVDTNTQIPGSSDTFLGFNFPEIDDGNVAFRGIGPTSSDRGIYAKISSSLITVADVSTLVPTLGTPFGNGFGTSVQMSGDIIAFFSDATQPGFEGLYSYSISSGSLDVLVDTSIPVPGGTGGGFRGLANFDVDGDDFTFNGQENNGIGGIWTNINDTFDLVLESGVTLVPDGVGTFSFYSSLAMDGGNITFFGRDSNGIDGIYTTLGGALTEVIDLNDVLEDGKSLTQIMFFREGFSGNSIAFRALFDDGSLGIYVASMSQLPEPTTLAIFAIGLAGLGFVRRRRIELSGGRA